ncbi:MAG: hypothetical protein UZ21_OP11001000669 [Microgenomates bacterium OLB22]|nr:MAG: hypothetical protein UZ21_OP11001000669 [Microgenomates bacterium OLB22]
MTVETIPGDATLSTGSDTSTFWIAAPFLYLFFCLLSMLAYKGTIHSGSDVIVPAMRSEMDALHDAGLLIPLREVLAAPDQKIDIYAECRPEVKYESMQDILDDLSYRRHCYFKHDVVRQGRSVGLRDAVEHYNDRMRTANFIKSFNVLLWFFDNEDTTTLSY